MISIRNNAYLPKCKWRISYYFFLILDLGLAPWEMASIQVCRIYFCCHIFDIPVHVHMFIMSNSILTIVFFFQLILIIPNHGFEFPSFLKKRINENHPSVTETCFNTLIMAHTLIEIFRPSGNPDNDQLKIQLIFDILQLLNTCALYFIFSYNH